jgi:uncharacterized protein YacL
MNMSLFFIRAFFVLLATVLTTTYTTQTFEGGSTLTNILLGISLGMLVAFSIMCLETSLRRLNLRIFNTLTFGLFVGFMMGQGFILVFDTVVDLNVLLLNAESTALIKTAVYLVAVYFGLTLTVRCSEKVYVNIPFIRLKPDNQRKKDVIIDASVLTDSRILDLANSGLLDHHLILPQFLLKELYLSIDSNDENEKSKAKRSLEVIKKLEEISTLDMRYIDNDFPEIKDILSKTLRLARLLDANILTADPSRIQQSSHEGVRFISIHFLSNALKPLTNAGEQITIKIQRYGKEARQGIGYLEDGTMVVVNGGADSLGETIRAQVLSVKHTSSGRMIFCNAADEALHQDEEGLYDLSAVGSEPGAMTSVKNYFTVKN